MDKNNVRDVEKGYSLDYDEENIQPLLSANEPPNHALGRNSRNSNGLSSRATPETPTTTPGTPSGKPPNGSGTTPTQIDSARVSSGPLWTGARPSSTAGTSNLSDSTKVSSGPLWTGARPSSRTGTPSLGARLSSSSALPLNSGSPQSGTSSAHDLNGTEPSNNGTAGHEQVGTQSTDPVSESPPVRINILKLTIPPDRQVSSSQASTPGSSPSSTMPTNSTFMPRRWRRSDRMLRRLNTELLESIENQDLEETERLLNTGANPNATCRLDLVSACHVAAIVGGGFIGLLVKRGAERYRLDRLGRTPIHLAAWAGNAKEMAVLLDFPEDMHERVGCDSMSSECEEDVRKLCRLTQHWANFPCDLEEVKTVLPNDWKDNIDHNCRYIKGTLPLLQPGWTPLHVASARAQRHCTRLLLAAGANPNSKDVQGKTPLDVAGSAHYHDIDIDTQNFTEVIRMLIKAGGSHNTMTCRGVHNVDTPLHTAVELECLDAIRELLELGVSVACMNAAGQTPLHVCVRKELEEPLQILANAHNEADPFAATVDVKDGEGHTVLQAAVEAAWVPGVCVALEAGADVTLKANDGETPIHSAAALGNLDVLNEILSYAKQKDSIDCQNTSGETPLYMAINAGHPESVLAILNEGASVRVTLPGKVNVFHRTTELGHLEILKILVEYDEEVTKEMINQVCDGDKKGFGPLHFAAYYNHPQCMEYLLSIGADVRLRTTCSPFKESTPLHIASFKNYLEIANIILNHDKTTIHEVNSKGWFPLHTAAHHVSREIIPVLLQAGGDLAGYSDGPKRYRRTAIDMIINNLGKPTEYLKDIFDSYISTNNHNLQDANSVVKLDYSVLMPRSCEMKQMKVIEALLKTGNRYGQKRLLVHPLVESFLYLKWKALLPFFYMILACYAFFVMSLTIFVVSVFFYKDTHESAPVWLDKVAWGYVVYLSILLILIQELLYMNVKSSRYFLQLETWVKFGSIGMATILPTAVNISSWSAAEWPRHVATVALLLSWIEMMFLLSRFPNWGYYVLMFGKVATNVVKILLTFAFLVIGFALSFMIQFRSQIPFEGPWAALVKTMVMMTSEFDYVALFDEQHTEELSTSILVVRVIFLVFLIMAAIVLMNLLVGVAVNDINDLEILGNIRRLAKQVEFLGTLDTLVYNKFFSKILPIKVNHSIRNKRNVANIIEIYPGRPKWRHTKIIPTRLRDCIFNKATEQKKQFDQETSFNLFRMKMEEIHDKIVKQDQERLESANKLKINDVVDRPARHKKRHEELIKHLTGLDEGMSEMKDHVTALVEAKSPLDEVNVKIDQMSLEIEGIKQLLSRLESKLGQL